MRVSDGSTGARRRSARPPRRSSKARTLRVALAATTLAASFSIASAARAQGSLPVFPGAEGFGTRTAAGRGGSVCRVTSLADAGSGTVRDCLEGRWPRTVVFGVGGTVRLESPLRIEHPHVSVYGQTAPGDGVLLIGSPDFEEAVLGVATHDVLLQHLRVRAGASRAPSCCRDAVSIASKRPGQVYNVVLDHVSLSWGSDEIIDIWYDARDVTVSRSIIAEGLHDSTDDKGPAGRGFVAGGPDSRSISIHHNLFAHNYQRNPMVASPGVTDVVNNVVYHWVSRGAQVHESGDEPVKVNLVGNLFVAGAARDGEQRTRDEWSEIAVKAPGDRVEIHLEGNVRERRDGSVDEPPPPQASLVGSGYDEGYDPARGWLVERRHPAPRVREVSARGLRRELADDVGATLPRRDAVDARIVRELRTGGGRMPDCVAPDDPPSRRVCEANNVGGWPAFRATSAEDRPDTDGDGIPDAWERAEGLDPDRAVDGAERAPTGYTWLETWVHSLDPTR